MRRGPLTCVLWLGGACVTENETPIGGSSEGEASGAASTTSAGSTSETSSDTTTASSVGDTSTGSVDASTSESSSTGASTCPELPASCPAAEAGVLTTVTESEAGPYLLRVGFASTEQADAVLFIPVGPGDIDWAMTTYDFWLAGGDTIDDFTLVVPYSDDGNVQDEHERVLSALDEVLACTCNSGRVHLAGASLGGISAYAMMLASPERFVTLLGAPGYFEALDPDVIGPALAGKPVFNGVGQDDSGWHADVVATHEFLVDLGVDSVLVEFPDQGHELDESFDESIFFEFWSTH